MYRIIYYRKNIKIIEYCFKKRLKFILTKDNIDEVSSILSLSSFNSFKKCLTNYCNYEIIDT